MKVMVIGAGIGGLTAALSLHAAGIDAQVYESVADMQALGAGINLQPNAVRELIELGLGSALGATAIETAELGYYNKHGQLIWSEPRGLAAGYAWPQYSIDRGDLQMILLAAVKERLGAENVFAGHHLVSFEQDGSSVTAQFTDRENGKRLPARRGGDDFDVLHGVVHEVVGDHPASRRTGAGVVVPREPALTDFVLDPHLAPQVHEIPHQAEVGERVGPPQHRPDKSGDGGGRCDEHQQKHDDTLAVGVFRPGGDFRRFGVEAAPAGPVPAVRIPARAGPP